MKTFLYSLICALFICVLAINTQAAPWDEHGKLLISKNGHFLQHEDGTPFLWIGDTGWGLFLHLDKQEVIQYLDNRQKTGFNVIQN